MSVENLRKRIDDAASRLRDRGLERLRGDDWYQLRDDEMSVFKLDLEDMPQLTSICDAYLAVLDVAYNDIHEDIEMCAEVREELPWLTMETIDEHEFMKFAVLFGATKRKANAVFFKMHFHDVRQGNLHYSDEDHGDSF